MFVIAMYDIGGKRVGKALKICRKYLNWIQNSVFEGELSKANLEKLKVDMQKIMDFEEDSFVLYILRDTKYSTREIIGLKKGGAELII
jgi:CRISPR-associated protein Cas2